jgi:hypothetical protein
VAVIFRRIRGRIVAITVEKVVEAQKYTKGTNITYKLRDGFKRIGEVWAQQSQKRPGRFIVGAAINKEFRGAGLGKEFYNKIGSDAANLGGKYLTGSTDTVAAIKKVRESVGRTKGYVGKGPYSGTTFVTSLKKFRRNK